MRDDPGPTPGLASETHSVQALVWRINTTFMALILIGVFIIFFLVYLPLNHALGKRLIDNFGQIAHVRCLSLKSDIERGLEGARILSSRSMIRSAMAEHRAGSMSQDELSAFAQPKYEESAQALKHLVFAERLAGDLAIARYAPRGVIDGVDLAGGLARAGDAIDSALYLAGDRVYLAVFSSIITEQAVLGYDRLIFDLTDCMRELRTDASDVRLLGADAFGELRLNASSPHSVETGEVFYKSGVYYAAFKMQDGVYFVLERARNSLLAPADGLSVRMMLVGIGILIAFMAAVYLYVVRFTRRQLVNMERSRSTLALAASAANSDSLTKIGSRRYGEQALFDAFEGFLIGAVSPAVMLIDIDSLKHINDTYGHGVGDRAITEVANAVLKSIRMGDRLARWGGDEFVGIFFGLRVENALPFASKLLEAVSAIQISLGEVSVWPTISIGVSYFKTGDSSYADDFNRADQAMYRSKSEGRNRATLL